MLKKLSNAEKANFYKAIADLENNYGVHRVEMALNELVANLDGRKPQPRHEQIELLPFEEVPEMPKVTGKRTFKGARPRGENTRLIKKYFEEQKGSFPGVETPAEMLIKMYYVMGLNQYKIAERVGVNQRAISAEIRSVSEKKKRILINRWENEENGY